MIEKYSISELTEKYKKAELSPVDVVKSALDLIKEKADLNYFICVSESAMAEAAASAERYKAGTELSPLDGVLYGLKDMIYTADMPTTQASALYQGYMAGVDATVEKLLEKAGAINMGKLNLQEMAFGAMGDVSYIGAAKNPYDNSRVCGGSSSGPAGAVASGMVHFSLTTDTGGSGRIPAALCGVVGLKATHGAISIKNVVPVCEELDHVGVMANSAEDCATVFEVLEQYDETDLFSRKSESVSAPEKFKAGVLRKYSAGADDYVLAALNKAADALNASDAALPEDFDSFRPKHQALLLASAFRNHKDDIDNNADRLGVGILDRLMKGNISMPELIDVIHAQEEFKRYFNRAFGDFDILLMPSVPCTAPLPGSNRAGELTQYCWQGNYSGFPCISVPMGFHEGLPIGIQIIAKEWNEELLFKVAVMLERINTEEF